MFRVGGASREVAREGGASEVIVSLLSSAG